MTATQGERRPWAEAAHKSSTTTTAAVLAQEDSPVRRRTAEDEAAMRELARFLGECRRRRGDAALRLPPMADGHRDPLGSGTDGAE